MKIVLVAHLVASHSVPDNMDEASKLVSELQTKLAELDQKVWQYRRDMATEFTKYAEQVLRDVPKDVSETVHKAIAESMSGYHSLSPDATKTTESCATATKVLSNGAANKRAASRTGAWTEPPHYSMQESEPEEAPRSPHERENEFQGLFTPTYLPLLDGTSSSERRPPYSPQTTPSLNKGKAKEMETLQAAESADTRSLTPSPDLRRPPTPMRRSTDEVSIASDYSDGPVRRSALRRTSSSSKAHSPRRVRFDVAGEEVLPTASPHPEEPILATDIPLITAGLDSDDEVGSEQVEDIDALPPKRISSSQALRALSRGPFEDDGTKWTAVSAPPDGSASVATAKELSPKSSSEDVQITNGFKRHDSGNTRGPSNTSEVSRYTSKTDKSTGVDEETDTFSDDDTLDMAASRTRQRPANMRPPIGQPNKAENKSSVAPSKSTNKQRLSLESSESGGDGHEPGDMKFLEEDPDEPFRFDADDDDERRPAEKPQQVEVELEDEEETEEESPVAQSATVSLSKYSTSPAREIITPSAPRASTPPTKGIVGSYKGHPFSMPIVSDEVHAKAASMGDINSFVGSVDGRSGVDESDAQSFRASGGVGSFTGAPRSMTQRMMLDDLLEGEESRRR